MAFGRPLRYFSLLLSLFHLISAAASARYFLPLVRDEKATQLYTSFLIGTPPVRVNLVVDLGNQFSWFACDVAGYNRSSAYGVVSCDSPQCPASSPCMGCSGLTTPSCEGASCGANLYTPWSDGFLPGPANLIDDTISLYSNPLAVKATLRNFPFGCAEREVPYIDPLKGLSRHTKGVVTLVRTPLSLNEHVSSSVKVPRKFALCVPSSASRGTGAVYFGGGPYVLPPSRADLSKSLVTTALVVNPKSTLPFYTVGDVEASVEYFIKVRSIKIDATPVKFNAKLLSIDKDGNGGTKITTSNPYTILHSQIYKPLVRLFVTKAAGLKLAKVAPVAPFGSCFRSKSIRYNAVTGKGLPIIDLVLNEKSAVLHGKNARWRIYGSNSMVKVSKDVQCLGFVDGGETMTPIAIGAKQLEDNLVEFDLEAKTLGFTSSLLRLGTSCSQVRGV